MPLDNPPAASGLSNPVTLGQGGTGQTGAPAALTALTGTQAAGQVVRSDGTNAALAALQHGDLPSLDNAWWPGDQNLIAWNFDPAEAGGNSAPALGVIQLAAVILRTAKTITNVLLGLAVVGTTLTSGQNFAGLYNSSGTQVGVTVDQTAVWASTGLKTMPLTAPYAAAAGTYWVAFVVNAAAACQFARGSAVGGAGTLLNAGLTASTARFATTGTVQTSLPGSITPASSALGAMSWWAGLS